MSESWYELTVPMLEKPIRLDSFLGQASELIASRAKAQQLIESKSVLVNGEPAIGKLLLKGGERVTFQISEALPSSLIPENIPLQIVYQDDYLAVIDKPAGLVTHPGAGNWSGTLVNALLYHFADLSRTDPSRPGIVHRLDKQTSGLLLVAKTNEIAYQLQRDLAARKIKRIYRAIVCGHMPEQSGTIDLPLTRSHNDRTIMTVHQTGRSAITDYRLLARYRSYDLLELSLQTGRTHQIRAHLAHLNHPVFGDTDYGGRERWHRGLFAPERPLAKRLFELIDRQALHAHQLTFTHPVTGKLLELISPLPADFQAVLKLLESEGA